MGWIVGIYRRSPGCWGVSSRLEKSISRLGHPMCTAEPCRRRGTGVDLPAGDVHAFSGPLVPPALAAWAHQVWYVALATSMLWHTSCRVRLSCVYRGRAVPIVWTVLAHPSSRVADDGYNAVLDQVAARLPCRGSVVLTADRGVAATPLLEHLTELGGPWRRRLNGSCWSDREGTRQGTVNRRPLAPGKALFWPHVYMTKQEERQTLIVSEKASFR
jgi:hypothetical protein